MKRTLIVLGGTGDLTGRRLLPSLAHIEESRPLEDRLEILAVSRRDWDDDGYQQWARERLTEHAPQVPAGARDRLLGLLGHIHGDVTEPEVLRAALDRAGGTPIIYLALPNTIFRPTLEALTRSPCPRARRSSWRSRSAGTGPTCRRSTSCCTGWSRSTRCSASTTTWPSRPR
jgi:glucose-6-phosphate 1-dehydrogenase